MSAPRSLNGTATNDSSAQTTNQRNAFSDNDRASDALGASRTTMDRIFNFDSATGRGSGAEIMARAEAVLGLNYGITPSPASGIAAADGVGRGKNPDFPNGHNSRDYKYQAGRGPVKFGDVLGMPDKPNKFGPNLNPPSINDPTLAQAGQRIGSPTDNYGNHYADTNRPDANGYGFEIETNDPRDADFVVSRPFFLERPTATTRQVLGEFFNSTYDYED